MHALSIIFVFAFLGVLSMTGAVMLVTSLRRFLNLMGNPILSGQHVRGVKDQATVSLNALLLPLGLILLAIGVRGIYRLIWAS